MEEMEERVPLTMEKTDHEDNFTHPSENHLTVIYTYAGSSLGMEGMVQSADPVPVENVVYYFVIKVKNAGFLGRIAAGFATAGWLDCEGSEYKKCYYHCDNGLIRRQQGDTWNSIAAEDADYTGQTYTTNDIVGCGINYVDQEYLFTKNGGLVGTLPMFDTSMYPTVTMHSNGEEVAVNFIGPFAFVFLAHRKTILADVEYP